MWWKPPLVARTSSSKIHFHTMTSCCCDMSEISDGVTVCLKSYLDLQVSEPFHKLPLVTLTSSPLWFSLLLSEVPFLSNSSQTFLLFTFNLQYSIKENLPAFHLVEPKCPINVYIYKYIYAIIWELAFYKIYVQYMRSSSTTSFPTVFCGYMTLSHECIKKVMFHHSNVQR